MNRRPFGSRGQYRPAPSTPSTLGRLTPQRQSPHGPRLRWAEWLRRGLVPAGLPPATLARGYRLAFGGLQPARDPERHACCTYSELELRLALQALGRPGPAQQLGGIWAAVLQRLPLPSTRMLLKQQARLILLTAADALVEVEPSWLAMASSRRDLLREAFAAELGHPVALTLRGGVGK